MSRYHRLIKSQFKSINEEPYATIQYPTNATFVSKEIMEGNEEKESVRQESKIVYDGSKLVKNKKTKRQEKKESFGQIMENETSGHVA